MASLVWTVPARQDVDDIYDFIANSDGRPLIADNMTREIIQKCETYAEAFSAGNLIGTLRPHLGEHLRVFSYKRWVVVFLPLEDGIEVVRVVDGSRDYGKLFE
ncbi:MAG: type II toxin-antitoxin system RelE/ParE family toxin [Planctomycetes bacterium]|nr:type II toxin-antitoxin system RelE/ParE family toxin [Planctomycetota bacterium]